MARPTPPPPGPDRDRTLAARPRNRPRYAEPLADLAGSFMKSEEIQRLRRFQRAAGALKATLTEKQRARIKPILLSGGQLTIEVADGPLLAELRQHVEHALLAALAAEGTGISRIAWRLMRSRR